MRVFLSILLTVVGGALVAGQSIDPKVILKRIDDQTNFLDIDYSCTANLVIARVGKEKEGQAVKFFRRDREDKFTIIIDQPDVKRGQGYLKLEDNLWFYDPNTRAFSHATLSDNFSDSDSRNSDFGKSNLANDYNVTEFSEDKLGKIDTYKLVLAGKTDTVPTPFETIWVTKDEASLVMQEQDFSLSKRLMRTNKYADYEKIRGRYVWKRALFIDNLVQGNFTQLNLKDIVLDALPDKVFTKTYVEQVSR
jgi:hypothetical protein